MLGDMADAKPADAGAGPDTKKSLPMTEAESDCGWSTTDGEADETGGGDGAPPGQLDPDNAAGYDAIPRLAAFNPLPEFPGDGRAGDVEGMTVQFLLDVGRGYASTPNRTVAVMEEMRRPDHPMYHDNAAELARLTSQLFAFWDKPKPESGLSVRKLLKTFLTANVEASETAHHPAATMFRRAYRAFRSECDQWPARSVEAYFVVLRPGTDGTVVIHEAARKVFSVLGLADTVHDTAFARSVVLPVRAKMTLLPWKGRWVSDGVFRDVTPIPSPDERAAWQRCFADAVAADEIDDGPAYFPVESGTFVCVACANKVPHTPDCRICKKCKSKYCSTRCQATDATAGHVTRCPSIAAARLEKMRQRQSAVGVERARVKAARQKLTCAEQLRKVAELGVSEQTWLLKRFGYTEVQNPHHSLLLLPTDDPKGELGVLAIGTCDKLVPTTGELLKVLLDGVQWGRESSGKLPGKLLIDVEPVVEEIRGLLDPLGIETQLIEATEPQDFDPAAAEGNGVDPSAYVEGWLAPGSEVETVGLVQQPEWNNRPGVIQRPPDDSADKTMGDRVLVLLEGDSTAKALKRVNIRPLGANALLMNHEPGQHMSV